MKMRRNRKIEHVVAEAFLSFSRSRSFRTDRRQVPVEAWRDLEIVIVLHDRGYKNSNGW